MSVTERIINEEGGSANYEYNGDKKVIQFQHIENWALIITANESDLKATSIEIRNITAITILVGVILSTLVSYFLVSKIITKPLSVLETAMEMAGNGDLNVAVDVYSKDEIGHLSRSFLKMIDALKDVLSTINTASDQVSSGSSQLSDSSMALSQGATEQASAVQELTATMEKISAQTNNNAENANKAKGIVDSIKSSVEVSNQQMDEMLSSMEGINQSSNNISKIIKVIDDIAFQTNILALNAAVEAARAGQHGKGFAVVAEEVRNLASQSANAAKDTTSLIEGSIKNVKEGTVIANSTAESLKEMVQEINIATDLVRDIARASTEQSFGVNQVNQGIFQISAVVQTTSATAEETAAASEELSSQAGMLQSKVETFKI
ncbi:MAG: HAMP domain-containing protein [Clostridiales bacterium]|nr:HAMP domain-containing protein [Clostridiales bacterium]